MFKIKNTNTLPYITSLIFGNHNHFFKQTKHSTNTLWLTTTHNTLFNPLNLLYETSGLFVVDSTALQNTNINSTTTSDVFYSYRYDLYIIVLRNGRVQTSLSLDFYNRIWLERETSEMFGVIYTNLNDTRPLLLNYGDRTPVMSKTTTTQPNYEYRTNWHSRSINKCYNQNVEL